MRFLNTLSAIFFIALASWAFSACDSSGKTEKNDGETSITSDSAAGSTAPEVRTEPETSPPDEDDLALQDDIAAAKEAKDSTSNARKSGPEGNTPATDAGDCYFKVSFISIGSGIDYKATQKLETEIKNFQQSKGVTLTYTKKNWGREGEQDYCFSTKGLSPVHQEEWAQLIRKTFKGNELVQFPAN